MTGLWNEFNGQLIFNVPRILFSFVHQIAWRFISSAIMIAPFILLIIAVRGKLSPGFRSRLFAMCFLGLLLPFQRSAFYLFDGLFPFVRNTSIALSFPQNGVGPYNIFELVSLVWLIGFLFFLVARAVEYRKTIKALKTKKFDACASYFYRFRSRIYLPSDFEITYTQQEQDMLLAHERQHIKQHDPLVYRLLVILECACWFNPLISIAMRHYKHERELLCDERVMRNCSKHDYGMLIVKAAREKKMTMRAGAAGIIMEFGSISERLSAIVEPMKTIGKRTAVGLICVTVLGFLVGLMGFRPAWMSLSEFSADAVAELGLREVVVYEIESFEAIDTIIGDHTEAAREYVILTEEGFSLDQDGLYEYALAQGLNDMSCLFVNCIDVIRPAWGSGNISSNLLGFTVESLKTKELSFGFSRNTDIYSILTDIFI